MNPDLRALIFDLDGVIVNTIYPHFLSWQRLAAEEHLPFTYEAYEHMLGMTREQGLAALLNGRVLDTATTSGWIARKNAYYLELIERFTPADAAPGITQLIDEARAAGLKIGLGSSSHNARRVLEKVGLLPKFDVVGDYHTVKRHKPFPDIYLWTANQLGITPEQALIFEDSDIGIQAARAGGFWVVGVGDRATPRAHLVLPSLAGMTLATLRASLDSIVQHPNGGQHA